MTTKPTKDEVLAWLLVDASRTATEAAAHFWPGTTKERTASNAGKIRMWLTRARRATDPPDEPPVAKQAATAPPTEDTSREDWLVRELASVTKDLRDARRRKDLRTVPGLTRTARELRAELDDLRRVPPPAPASSDPGAARPVITANVAATLTPLQLALLLRSLMHAEDDGPITDERLAELEAEALAIEERARQLVRERGIVTLSAEQEQAARMRAYEIEREARNKGV